MNKKKSLIVLISTVALIVLALATYFLNSKFHFLADVLEGPYTIFQKENFAQVGWDTRREADVDKVIKSGSSISAFAAKGQIEDISFSVRPTEDLGEVQVNLTDLKMGNKVIPKENIEVLNLKVWPQCAPEAANPNGNWIFNCQNTNYKPPTYSEAYYRTINKGMPELLVKNNEQDLVAAEGGMVKNADNTFTYNAPAVDPNFKAVLKAGKTHTFYLRIKVPADATEGDYKATVEFAPANNIQSTSFSLALNVLPFELPESSKDIASFVGYRIDDKFVFQGGRQSIGEEKFAKYLDFLKSAGFTTLIINDYNNIDKVAKMMKDRGFKRIIWSAIPYPNGEWLDSKSYYNAATFKNKINQIKAAGYEDVYVYGYDEPNMGSTLFRNIEYAKFIHESGAKVATAITRQTFDISNTKLLLHDMAVVTVEESKIDLPIYAGAYSNSAIYSDYVAQYFDRSFSFPILNDVPAFQIFPRGETINQANGYTAAWSGLEKELKFSSAVKTFDVSTYLSTNYSISLKIGDEIAVKSSDGLNTYVNNKDYIIEEKNISETDTTKAVFITIPDASKIKPMTNGNYQLKIAFKVVPAYKETLSKNTWHHIAGVWDGKTSKYKLYVDNNTETGFEYEYTTKPSPFGNLIPKNGNRTYIGAAIDAIKPLSTGKSRDGIVGFRGNIAGVKIYNQALTKEQIDTGTVLPKADYDFSEGELNDKTGTYPACQNKGAELSSDNPTSGKKSFLFGKGRTAAQIETPNAPHLDCGVVSDNYGIEDSLTVEAWIKLPNETAITNQNGAIISRLEAYDRSYIKSEDYIVGMRKKTVSKSPATEFFYSQIWPEMYNLADRRGAAGFYLQASGLNGFSPYGLDSPFASAGAKFYDDFDSVEKAEFAVLPSASGDPVLTYQFESFRTGVDDSKYMTLYDGLLTKLKVKDAKKANVIDKDVQAMLDKYPYNMDGNGSTFIGKPNSFHQANRKLVADKIVEMQKILNDKPSHIGRFNVEEGQKVKTNPYMLSVKVKDASKVSKVEYYIDNILIGTSTLPDVNGVFDWPWDTSKYHSIVKIIVYGTDGQTEELTRNTTVDLSSDGSTTNTDAIVTVLPKTGESSWWRRVSDVVTSLIQMRLWTNEN